MKIIKQRVGKIQKFGVYFYWMLRRRASTPMWFIKNMFYKCLFLRNNFSEEFIKEYKSFRDDDDLDTIDKLLFLREKFSEKFKKYTDEELFSKVSGMTVEEFDDFLGELKNE